MPAVTVRKQDFPHEGRGQWTVIVAIIIISVPLGKMKEKAHVSLYSGEGVVYELYRGSRLGLMHWSHSLGSRRHLFGFLPPVLTLMCNKDKQVGVPCTWAQKLPNAPPEY